MEAVGGGDHAAQERALTDKIVREAEALLASYGQHPTPEVWEGLRAIAASIAAQVFGSARRAYHLSSLPTGGGKSTMIVAAVRVLTRDPAYADVGVVIFVNQLRLIRSLIEAMRLEAHQFAIARSTSEELNAMGVGPDRRTTKQKRKTLKGGRPNPDYLPPPASTAQVLFTTQQKLMRMNMHPRRRFADDPFFQYQGKERTVRIWDEAMVPTQPVTVTTEEVRTLAAALEHPARGTLLTWADELDAMREGVTRVPEWTAGLKWKQRPDSAAHRTAAQIWDELWKLARRKVPVYYDAYRKSPTVMSYIDLLPPAFAPVLVLDAFGEMQEVYRVWAHARGDLVFLPSPGKTYANLETRWFDMAAGKGVYRNRDGDTRDTLLAAVVQAYSETKPGEPVLFIMHKDGDMERHIRRALDAAGLDDSRAQFLTWGCVTGHNDYRELSAVIIVGVLQAPLAEYIALWRGAAKVPPDASTDPRAVELVRQGEVSKNIIQGVGRSAVRRMSGTDVPPGSRLWLIASSGGNMPITRKMIARALPGTRVTVRKPAAAVYIEGGARLKSTKRKPFMDAMREREGECFEVRDFEPDFDKGMARRFIHDFQKPGPAQDYLTQEGLALSQCEPLVRGRAKVHRYRVDRLAA